MKSLLRKETDGQWSAEHAIEWRQPISRPIWMRRKTYVKLMSQFYHGELATQRLCRRLIEEVDDPDCVEFLHFQLRDEIRHEAVYTRYLERLGDIAPIETELEEALVGSLAWQGSPLGLIVAFHVVFEGGALQLLEHLGSTLPCPLFREINAKVLPDEARHVAFGVNYLRQHLPTITRDERLALYFWLRGVWQESARSMESRHSLTAKIATRLPSNWMAIAWRRQNRLLQNIGLISPTDGLELPSA